MKIYYTNQYDNNKDRTSSHRLLQEVLMKYCGIPEGNPVIRPQGGKPHLAMPEASSFSVSHTGRFWCCIIADHEIGLDVERLDRRLADPKKLIRRYFLPDEAEYVEKAADENQLHERMLALWTRKEALLKYSGDGLRRISSSGSVLDHEGVDLCTFFRDSIILSVCAPKGTCRGIEPQWIEIATEDILL